MTNCFKNVIEEIKDFDRTEFICFIVGLMGIMAVVLLLTTIILDSHRTAYHER